MQTLNLGHETTISPQWVKTHTTLGWVARIAGTDPQYGLKRKFLDRETPENPKLPRGWHWWRITALGLYEYRNLGNGTLSGFFTVESSVGRRRVQPVQPEAAHAMAARMR